MLKTEMRNPKTMHVDQMSPLEICQVMNEENRNAVDAVQQVLPQIAAAVDGVTAAFAAGGRLFYMGAGTSGRLGVVDASECPPTFGVSPELVQGIIAGGESALTHAAEGQEDDPEAGIEDLKRRGLTGKDVVVGVSAAGGAAYVINALKYAASLGCLTVGITSNPGSELDRTAKISIAPDTGAEVITGSTRLKAGTAQKLILNMISTAAMIRSGYVYENMMINLRPVNKKLRLRVIRITKEITGLDDEKCVELLDRHNWVIRDAVEESRAGRDS